MDRARRPRVTGDALLLRHLAALERMTADERPSAEMRLAAKLGRETARSLLSSLGPTRPGRPAAA